MRSTIYFVALFLISAAVNAASVKWELTDVVFDDGGTASGSFTYDADSNVYSNISIVTTLGSIHGGAEYQFLNPFFEPREDRLLVVEQETAESGSYAFNLLFDESLIYKITGDEVGFGNANEALCSLLCNGIVAPVRRVSSGVVTAVTPIPAAAWLFGSALAGLGWLRRKQTV
jgi:hypothetical protein